MPDDFDLRNPDSFVAGTVGPPGQRIFFLQARDSGHVVSLKLEKGQVWALANLLSELLEREGFDGPVSNAGSLVEPVTAQWTIGRLATGLDSEGKTIVVIAEEIDDNDESDPDDDHDDASEDFDDDAERTTSRARFHLDYGIALGFAQQAMLLVEDGRDFGMRNGHRPPQG